MQKSEPSQQANEKPEEVERRLCEFILWAK